MIRSVRQMLALDCTHERINYRSAVQAMRFCLVVLFSGLIPLKYAGAQEAPARRLSNVVGVAVGEYGKAVDARGRIVSQVEYAEALDFLADARGVAARLRGANAETVRSLVDSLTQTVEAKSPPDVVGTLYGRLVKALGRDGMLELPTVPVDLSAGQRIYGQQCASCHGVHGLGDGPAAKAGSVPAPAIGTQAVMGVVSPARAYRIVSVGVPGTLMADFSSTLSVADRWNVVAYVNSLRVSALQLRRGETQFTKNCATCHAGTITSHDAIKRERATLTTEIRDFAWQSERSDEDIARVVRDGIAGHAMPKQRAMTTSEIATVVAYVRHVGVNESGSQEVGTAPVTETGVDDPLSRARATGHRVMVTLDSALALARIGRTQDAGDVAFDAYFVFEPLETTVGNRNTALVASMERRFTEFKGAVRAGDIRQAQQARDAIEAGLPAVVALAHTSVSGWGAFYQSFLIILREGFEAILVLGAIVALLVKTGNRERLRSVWTGAGLALLASVATAALLATALRAIPASREVIEGVAMLVSVAVLFSISYWLISRAEAARWQSFIRDKVARALQQGGGSALTLVAFLAVYREGAETALFFQALFADSADVLLPLSLGIVAGFGALAVVFTLFYRYGVRVPMRPFFAGTSALLYYMAFTFMGRGIRELQEGDVLPMHVIRAIPTVDVLGVYGSWEGVLAQATLLVLALIALGVTFWPKRAAVVAVKAGDVQATIVRTEPDVAAEQSAAQTAVEPCAACIAAGRTDVRKVRAEAEPVGHRRDV